MESFAQQLVLGRLVQTEALLKGAQEQTRLAKGTPHHKIMQQQESMLREEYSKILHALACIVGSNGKQHH